MTIIISDKRAKFRHKEKKEVGYPPTYMGKLLFTFRERAFTLIVPTINTDMCVLF